MNRFVFAASFAAAVLAAPALAAPGAGCAAKLVNVYDRSRAGPWYALFKRPVCGTAVSVGPRSPWGDNMITIDRTSYYEKGDDWVPLKR